MGTGARRFQFFLFVLLLTRALVHAHDQTRSFPNIQYVNAGDSARFLCKISGAIENCIYKINDKTYRLKPGPESNGVRYVGLGFERGECGMQIDKVTERHNGNITCSSWMVDGQAEAIEDVMRLVVTVSPSKPVLEVHVGNQRGNSIYKERDVLIATCTVKGGRPVANISWFLEDDRITDGLRMPEESCISPQEICDIQQNLTRTLLASDNKKKLRCIVDHPSLKGSQEIVEHQIYVNYPPKRISQPIQRFGLVEGIQGRVPVVIEANPKPTIQWKVGTEYINEGENKGRYTVEPTTNEIPGQYETALLINALTKDDTNFEYTVTAKNELGIEYYAVTISTSVQPKVTEFDTGMLIVIAVAIVIIILILAAVFIARAKGKFCFAVTNAEKMVAPPSEGTENPAVNHHASTEYINKSPEMKKEKSKEDTPV